jgi:hypothetical protein
MRYKNRKKKFFSLLYYNNQAGYNKIFLHLLFKIKLVRTIILELRDNIKANTTATSLIAGYITR